VTPVVEPVFAPKSKEIASTNAKSKPSEVAKSFFGNPKPKSSNATKGKTVNSTAKVPDLQICKGDSLFPPQTNISSTQGVTSKSRGVLSDNNKLTGDQNGIKPTTKEKEEIKKVAKSTTVELPKDEFDGNGDAAENEATSKKRRRIRQISSSEEEEEANDEKEDRDLYIPPSPEEEVVVEPIAITSTDLKSKTVDVKQERIGSSDQLATTNYQTSQRKLVSKTYVNDEGFIVTEKVWESQATTVSAASESGENGAAIVVADSDLIILSDNLKDKEIIVKPESVAVNPSTSAAASKPPAKKSKKGAAAPSSKQQTSMMTFFKKT